MDLTQRTRWVTYFLRKSVIVECRIEVNESQKVTDGCEHALAYMIPKVRSDLGRPEDWQSCISVGSTPARKLFEGTPWTARPLFLRTAG